MALLIMAPVFVVLRTSGLVIEQQGSEQFFQAAIAVLGALIIAFVFQFKSFLQDLYYLVGRGDSFLIVPALISWLASFIGGIAFGLSALNNCDKNGCGSVSDFNNMILALGVAGLYLVLAFVVGAVVAHLEHRPATSD